MMNPNPSGLDPTARSFTGQFTQTQNQPNVYQLGAAVSGLQHLQGGLQSGLSTRPGYGTLPASTPQPTDRFQPNYNQLSQYQQAQSRHVGLGLGSFSANPNVRNQYGTQLGLQNPSLAPNRQMMNVNLPGMGVNASQTPQGLPGMQQWSAVGQQQQLGPSNLHSLSSMSRLSPLSAQQQQQQQQQLAQVRSMNQLSSTLGRDLSQASSLTGMLQQQQQQQQSPNPSQDLLSMMRSNQRNVHYPLYMMPQVHASGRSALTLERPTEASTGINPSLSSLKLEPTAEFPALSEVNVGTTNTPGGLPASASLGLTGTKLSTLSLTEGEGNPTGSLLSGDKKEEYPSLSSAMEPQGLKASVHGVIGRNGGSGNTSGPLTSEGGSSSGGGLPTPSPTYFQASHNMPASVQASLKNIQASGVASRSPPPPPQSIIQPTTSPRNSTSLFQSTPDDGFSLPGLKTVIRRVEEDLSMLALGQDLTLLGLKLDDPGSELHKTFISPWSNHQMPGKSMEFELPLSYKNIKEKIRPEYFTKFKDETLFYVFYSSPCEEAQALAGAMLSQRGLVWHKDHKQWFARVPNQNIQKLPDGERGSYVFFDTCQWKYVQKDNFSVKYDAVESSPNLVRPQMPIAIK